MTRLEDRVRDLMERVERLERGAMTKRKVGGSRRVPDTLTIPRALLDDIGEYLCGNGVEADRMELRERIRAALSSAPRERDLAELQRRAKDWCDCPAAVNPAVHHSENCTEAHEQNDRLVNEHYSLRKRIAEAETRLQQKHQAYRDLYALWLRVARAMTPAGGPDITDEQVAERAEQFQRQLAEERQHAEEADRRWAEAEKRYANVDREQMQKLAAAEALLKAKDDLLRLMNRRGGLGLDVRAWLARRCEELAATFTAEADALKAQLEETTARAEIAEDKLAAAEKQAADVEAQHLRFIEERNFGAFDALRTRLAAAEAALRAQREAFDRFFAHEQRYSRDGKDPDWRKSDEAAVVAAFASPPADALRAEVERAFLAGRDAAIAVIDGGHFQHEKAPPRLFATEVIAAIRREVLAPPAPDAKGVDRG